MVSTSKIGFVIRVVCIVFCFASITKLYKFWTIEQIQPASTKKPPRTNSLVGLTSNGLPGSPNPSPSNIGGVQLKRCMFESSKDLWTNLAPVWNVCATKFAKLITSESFVKFHMGRLGETKNFLPLVEKNRSPRGFKCLWLTIGIGGDANVEKEFKLRYPECKVYGVEPAPNDTADFAKYGTVIPVGAGVKNGVLTMRLRGKGDYEFHNVSIQSLPDLLDQHLHQRLVHFVTLDVEGFEYPLLRAFKFGQEFDQAGVVFCQLDVELHTPQMPVKFAGGIQKFGDWDSFMRDFLRFSPYVPVSVGTIIGHRKVTLVNPNVLECMRVFDFEKYQLQ